MHREGVVDGAQFRSAVEAMGLRNSMAVCDAVFSEIGNGAPTITYQGVAASELPQ